MPDLWNSRSRLSANNYAWPELPFLLRYSLLCARLLHGVLTVHEMISWSTGKTKAFAQYRLPRMWARHIFLLRDSWQHAPVAQRRFHLLAGECNLHSPARGVSAD